MADHLIEQGQDEYTEHLAGQCEAFCRYCEEEEKKKRKQQRIKKQK